MKNLIYVLLLIGGVMIVMEWSDGMAFKDDSSSVYAATKDFNKTFTAESGQKLELQTDIGSVNVEGTSDNQVVIIAEIKGSDDAVNDFEITAEQNSGGVTIRGEKKSKDWSKLWNNFNVNYTVKVPKSFNLNIKTAGGNIKITGLNGTLDGTTSGGNITLTGVDGKMDFTTSGGNIEVDKSKGTLDITTSGGNVRIENSEGDVAAATSGGNMTFSGITGKLEAGTSGGNIKAKINGPNKGITLKTSGGDIAVWIASDVKAALDAATSGGEVTCELPVTISGKIKSDRIRGDINGGGEPIILKTSGGDIDVKKLQ
jgi:hypothetical protein